MKLMAGQFTELLELLFLGQFTPSRDDFELRERRIVLQQIAIEFIDIGDRSDPFHPCRLGIAKGM